MFSLNDSNRFFLYPYPTDMRKSFYSLSGIVTNEMGMNVQNGDAFCFVNKNLTSIKILHAEFGGLVIYNMKLEKGAIRLPDIDFEDPGQSKDISWTDLVLMIQGITPERCERRTRWMPAKRQIFNRGKCAK